MVPCRLLRASVFAVVCVCLTMAGHSSVSSQAVPAVAVAGGLGLLGLTWVLAGHERSLATILAGLLGGQFVLHVTFAAVQTGPSAHGGHDVGPAEPGASMTSVHVALAVLSAWWLWRGERLAWTLVRRVTGFAFFGPLDVQPRARRSLNARRQASVRRPLSALLLGSVGLRGPPFRPVFV